MLPYIIGIVVGAILIFFKNKYSNAMALLKNLATKEKLLEKTEEQLKNNVEMENIKKQIQELHSKTKEGTISNEELAKWLNDYFNGNPK